MAQADFYRMAPLEVAAGWVPGHVAAIDLPVAGPAKAPANPRRQLELAIMPALRRSPCMVAFSGGRDSSAVLAVAVALARQEGLPVPVPVTRTFPNLPETDETVWQERVLRHLGIAEWVRLRFDDELDLVGPIAACSLRQHGLVWPPAAHLKIPLLTAARGGALLTGEGGDEVFGPRRSSALRQALAGRLRPGPRLARLLLDSMTPGLLRARRLRSLMARGDTRSWLRPPARAWFRERCLDDELGEPFGWLAGSRRLLTRRSSVIGAGTLNALAAESEVTNVNPLLDPAFLEALAIVAGRWGFVNRTAAMIAVFGDLLPGEVLSRRSKAEFNRAAFNRYTREFARAWDGSGVDAELVDPDALRAQWLADLPHAGSAALLHAAWLARPTV